MIQHKALSHPYVGEFVQGDCPERRGPVNGVCIAHVEDQCFIVQTLHGSRFLCHEVMRHGEEALQHTWTKNVQAFVRRMQEVLGRD